MADLDVSVQELMEKIRTLPSAELLELDTFVDFFGLRLSNPHR